jgi:hypothetical protein
MTTVAPIAIKIALLCLAAVLSHFGELSAPLAAVLGTGVVGAAAMHVAQVMAAVGAQRAATDATHVTSLADARASLTKLRAEGLAALQQAAPIIASGIASAVGGGAAGAGASASTTTGAGGKPAS